MVQKKIGIKQSLRSTEVTGMLYTGSRIYNLDSSVVTSVVGEKEGEE
jgi:hypothetical protein